MKAKNISKAEQLSIIKGMSLREIEIDLDRIEDLDNVDLVVDVITNINITLFILYATSKRIGPDQFSDLRCLAGVQADKILWGLKDYVEHMEEML